MSGLTLRAAAADDREPVLDLLEHLFDPPGRRPPDYTRARGAAGFEWAVTTPEADILLTLDGGTLLGLCTVYLDFPSLRFGWRCWVEDLVVHRDHRSLGVGRLLLDAAADWGRQRGATHLELDSAPVRLDAHRFYARAGLAQDSAAFSRRLD